MGSAAHAVDGVSGVVFSGRPHPSSCIQSNPLTWISLGPDYEYPLRQSVHLSMFYTLHLSKQDQTNDINLSGIHLGRF